MLDSTLREQHPGVSFTNKQNSDWMLDYFGVIKLKFHQLFQMITSTTKTIIKQGLRQILFHKDALKSDIDISLDCDANGAAYLGISDIHQRKITNYKRRSIGESSWTVGIKSS